MLEDRDWEIRQGDVLDLLRGMPDQCVQTCVTSPPYWGLRSYLPNGHADKPKEMGSEQSPDEYVARMVEVFAEVRRVLRDDGTLFLNLGDCYYSNPGNGRGGDSTLSGAKPHLSGAQRVKIYGTSGKEPEDCQDHGYPSQSLCDECREACHHTSHSDGQLAPKQSLSLSVPSLESKESKHAHFPTSDFSLPEDHNVTANSDQENIANPVDVQHLFSQASMIGESSLLSQDGCSQAESLDDVSLLSSGSSVACAQVCADTMVSPDVSQKDLISTMDHPASIDGNEETGDSSVFHKSGKAYDCPYRHYTTAYHHGQLKPKDLVGIPWMVAFALRSDGWYLRSDIIWSKPNPMPESVTDRPTKAHEYLFLLSKSAHYFYDAEAIREERVTLEGRPDGIVRDREWGYDSKQAELREKKDKQRGHGRRHAGFNDRWDQMTKEEQCSMGRNKRDVWIIATEPFPGSYFAVFPTKLIEPCILAGSSPKACPVCGAPWGRRTEREGGKANAHFPQEKAGVTQTGGKLSSTLNGVPGLVVTTGWTPTCSHDNYGSGKSIVLDPFSGSGTTVMVALRHGRKGLGLELNEEYVRMSKRRIINDNPMFNGLEMRI